MNNKIDDVMITLLKAKENIMNKSNNGSYDDIITGLDNMIVDYTIKNKMTNKEILDCAMSLYEHKGKNNFMEKIKNLSPSKLIQRTKNKIIENHKKKQIREKYEEEIVLLVKDRLKTMIDEDRKKTTTPDKTQEKQKDFFKDKNISIVNNGIISIDDNLDIDKDRSILVLDKEMAKIVDVNKAGTFIFQDNDNYFVYRKSDNIHNSDIEKSQLVKFSSLDQAIVYSIDDNVSAKDIRNDFGKFKNKYGNLDNFISDKRSLKKSRSNINYVDNSINMNLETKNLRGL